MGGGQSSQDSKSLPFLECIMDCELLDPGYSGYIFTWYNGWSPSKRIWKRLDRILASHEWMSLFDSTNFNHLIRTGSDHSPLFLIAKTNQRDPIKYFKFLDLWAEEVDFKSVVEQAWNIKVQGSPMWRFHLKLKNTSRQLSEWSKNTVGNIFDRIKELKDTVGKLEDNIILDNSENMALLNQANAMLIRVYKKEESFWKQKSGVMMTLLGKLSHFFQNLFTKKGVISDMSILDCIPKIINDADNEMLTTIPTMEELREVVFAMSSQSAVIRFQKH
ncbi:uncharacterized protein LOC107814397 [Nicotiana tabacum]|uniref:Uncharacterized protein LOC107814397 n=1 Tax=Nicotiana tabacum TaxID=4097 RepID=A0AC58TWR8_TOBAC